MYLEVPQFIPTTHLIKAIAALKGVDKRTINKYLKLLEGFGCIKKSGMSQYEFCLVWLSVSDTRLNKLALGQ